MAADNKSVSTKTSSSIKLTNAVRLPMSTRATQIHVKKTAYNRRNTSWNEYDD